MSVSTEYADELEASCRAKDAQIAALKEALRPFAKEAELYDEDRLDQECLVTDMGDVPGVGDGLTVGDLRRARSTYEGKTP